MRFVAMALLPIFYIFLLSWIRKGPVQRQWAYFGLGLLPFTVNAWNLDVSLVNWSAWPGYSKGLIITVLDLLAVAIIVTHRQPRGAPPMTWFIVAYLLAATLSVAMTPVPMASFFFAFQVARLLVLFMAVAKIADNPRALRWLAMGLAAGISYQAGMTIWQRAHGAFQASGTMGHQNLLGLMTHFVTLPLLAMLLGGMRNRVIMLGVVSVLIVLALGASRGAIGFGAAGIGLLITLSLIRHSTPHKWKMVGFGALALALVSPFVVQSLQQRYAILNSGPRGGDERAAFERAARYMFADHPMGVGANQYVVVANTQGYSDKAGVIWNWSSRAANVHNTYLLVAAETGWFGLISFVSLFVAVIFNGLRFAFQDRRDPRGDVVLGCTVAVAAAAAHNFYEWVFVTYQAQYVFAISVGIISGMIRARAQERRVRRRRPVDDSESELLLEPAFVSPIGEEPTPVRAETSRDPASV